MGTGCNPQHTRSTWPRTPPLPNARSGRLFPRTGPHARKECCTPRVKGPTTGVSKRKCAEVLPRMALFRTTGIFRIPSACICQSSTGPCGRTGRQTIILCFRHFSDHHSLHQPRGSARFKYPHHGHMPDQEVPSSNLRGAIKARVPDSRPRIPPAPLPDAMPPLPILSLSHPPPRPLLKAPPPQQKGSINGPPKLLQRLTPEPADARDPKFGKK